MTTFAELRDLTIEQTRKPELVGITNAAIVTAVKRAHHFDFFPDDIQSVSLTYAPTASAIQQLSNAKSLMPNFRAQKALFCQDPVTFQQLEQLGWRELDDFYDLDGRLKPSIYTYVGSTLRFVPLRPTGSLASYYYANPVTTEVGFASWIADAYPEQVAMLAATGVWSRTGFREMANDADEKNNKPFRQLLINSHILGEVN